MACRPLPTPRSPRRRPQEGDAALGQGAVAAGVDGTGEKGGRRQRARRGGPRAPAANGGAVGRRHRSRSIEQHAHACRGARAACAAATRSLLAAPTTSTAGVREEKSHADAAAHACMSSLLTILAPPLPPFSIRLSSSSYASRRRARWAVGAPRIGARASARPTRGTRIFLCCRYRCPCAGSDGRRRRPLRFFRCLRSHVIPEGGTQSQIRHDGATRTRAAAVLP